jgi:hypothetical protein
MPMPIKNVHAAISCVGYGANKTRPVAAWTGLLLALVFPIALAAADLKIDHATVAGANLDTMRKALTAVAGFPTEYGGPHSNHATEMALVSFPDGSYLELMGIQAKPDPAAVAAHDWSKFLQNNAGPCAFALRVPDLSAEVKQLKSAKITVDAPEAGGRTRPDGTKLVWQTVNVGPGRRGSLFPFLIADLTPRENRAYPSGKPTTDRFGGIGKVVIGVHDLEGVIAQYRRAFGFAAPLRQKDAKLTAGLAWFEGTPIVLAKGLNNDSWLSRRVSEYGDAPVAFVLKAAGSFPGSRSMWFDRPVVWLDDAKLGWRLGVEVGP